jgi:hypothetical protein
MSDYREPTEPIRLGDTGEWADFPASPAADPWAALMREANGQQAGNASLPGSAPMVKRQSSNHLANADHGLLEARYHFADYWEAKGAVMTSLAVALRGLLVTTIAVAIVAFLLLTNSHI